MNEDTNEKTTPIATPPQGFQTQSEEINELAGALSLAQGDMHPAKKTGDNTFFKSTYADLHSVIEATRFPLSANDLSMIQYCDDGYVITQLMHSSGQWLRGRLRITPKDNSPQAMGSALSYARRYSWQMMVGLASADDDGEAAMGRGGDDEHGSAHAKPKPKPKRKTPVKKTEDNSKTARAPAKKKETETVVEDEALHIVNATPSGMDYLIFHDVDPGDLPEAVRKRIIEKGLEGVGEMVSAWVMESTEKESAA